MLFKGITIGISIAAPVGPIGLLCIRRSLEAGLAAGLATGLGAASADALYGCIAGFGLTAVSSFLIHQRLWLALFGGIFLCYLAIKIIFAKPVASAPEATAVGLLPAYGSTLVLTLTNPMTILSFVAVFAGCGLGAVPDYIAAGRLVFGVFLGSALWWLLLSGLVSLVRAKINSSLLQLINWASGTVILGFGLYALSKVLTS